MVQRLGDDAGAWPCCRPAPLAAVLKALLSVRYGSHATAEGTFRMDPASSQDLCSSFPLSAT